LGVGRVPAARCHRESTKQRKPQDDGSIHPMKDSRSAKKRKRMLRPGAKAPSTSGRDFEKLPPVKQPIVTLDMEGVVTPEIWIAVAEKTGIKELRRTTREEPDYDKLMRRRLAILEQHGLKLSDIQQVIGSLAPLPGGKQFLDELRS